jgi:hypothetical protein
MAAIKGLNIPITATYDGKGVTQATQSLGSLEGLANKLTKRIAGVFAADKIYEFGKSTVEAFATSQKQAALLDNTLKNLGIQIQGIGLNDYLQRLSETTGVLKSDLVPAFQTAVTATKSVASAQSLLNTALDVSAGSGQDLAAVTAALGKAYDGNFGALKKMGLGLTATDLASKDFLTVQAKLNSLFKGDAQASANSYAGQINKLKAGFEDLKISIGQGLVNAFTNLAGNGGSLDSAITKMREFGLAAQTVLSNIGSAGGASSGLGGFLGMVIGGDLSALNFILTGHIKSVEELSTEAHNKLLAQNTKLLEQYYAGLENQKKLQAQMASDQAKANAANLAAANKALALEKAKQVLTAAGKVTDLQQIEIAAALAQNNDQAVADRLNLQKALLDGNATAAGNLAQKVLAANTEALNAQAINPFSPWADSAQKAIDQIKILQSQLSTLGSATQVAQPSTASYTLSSGAIVNPGAGTLTPGPKAPSIVDTSSIAQPANYALYASPWNFGGSGPGVVQVQVSVDQSGKLITNIQNGLNQQTANGSPNAKTTVNPLP